VKPPEMELLAYRTVDLPEPLFWQVLTFSRVEWPDVFGDDPTPEILPGDWHPVHFVLARGTALISHAAVVSLTIEHAGEAWKTYGLSSVFTLPALRGQGCGRRVVAAASAHVDRLGDGDLGLLFAAPELERFYGPCGWQALHSTKVLVGDRAAPRVNPGLAMLRPLSPRIDAQTLADASLYVGPEPW
jgi:GNAT superfamily N-acetyltransferase